MENGTPSPSSVKGNFIQLGLCIIISIAQLSAGMSMGFSAVTLPYMQKEISYINVTSDQASWIAGLAAITIPIGCLISGPILDRWGRKTGLLLVNLPAFIGWLLIAIQPNLLRLYIGRALTGLAGGLASVPATVYFAEIATKSMRGFLINGTSIAIATGVLIVYILGYFLKEDWRMVASICAVFPLSATILIAMLVPESPIWLISKGRNKRAYSALQVIRGVSDKLNLQEEINIIVNQNNLNRKNKLTLKETLNLFTCPEVYKPLFIMIMFFFFQQFSGIFVIIFYAVDIAQQSGINMDPYIVSMAIALMRLIFTLFAAWFTKKVGRRPPAILSGFGMTISLFVLICHLNSPNHSTPKLNSFDNKTDLNNSNSINNSLIDLNDNDLRPISWVPLLAILLYVIFSTIGFLTLPWSMIGEVFPSQVRGVGGGLSTFFAYIASFITVKSYPLLSCSLHQSGIYTIFGIMAFIGTLFVIFLLPETQGKTLQEIEQYFKTGGKKRSQNKDDSQENKIMLSTVTKPVIQPKS